MDIVDSQVHFNQIGPLAMGLAAMDAVGVASVLFDDFTGEYDAKGNALPGHLLPNGAFRYASPEAEAAALRYPERFGVMRRVHYRDPDLPSIYKLMAMAPYVNAVRMSVWDETETAALANDEYDRVIQLAVEHDLPVIALTQGRTDLLRRYAQKYPSLRLIIDHCGTPQKRNAPPESLDAVCEMARYENVTLKWSHAPFFFATNPYPWPEVVALLKRMISAFGPERVMWGSDFTVTRKFGSWAEKLFYVRDSPELSQTEKEWVLGRTARKILRWPVKQEVAT